MARQHKAPQYNVACAECMKIHPSSSIAGLQKEAEERIAKDSQNIDHERSFMNLTIHGLDVFGNPVVNHEKPERSLEERIYGRINEVGAKVRFDKQETSVERGHNSKESVICEGIIFQVSHEPSMELLAEDGMLDENGQIRKDCELPEDGKMYSLFMDTYRFACERFGADNIVGAYIHLDECTPHMHLFVVPVTMKESRYAGKVRLDEHGKPIMKEVLDAKNIFSPTTIKQLWADYAMYIEKYGVSKAEGKVPKGMYTVHPYPQIWTYRGTIDDLCLQIQIERMINATLVTSIHFTGFEKQETSNGPEYLFYGSNSINYYRDVHENVISSYYKNIPDIKTCHDRIGDRIWKREIIVTEVKNVNESRSQGNGMKKG